MTLKSDAKFEEKLAFGFKYDMRNFGESSTNHPKVRRFHFNGLFLSKEIQMIYVPWH